MRRSRLKPDHPEYVGDAWLAERGVDYDDVGDDLALPYALDFGYPLP